MRPRSPSRFLVPAIFSEKPIQSDRLKSRGNPVIGLAPASLQQVVTLEPESIL